jgi:hypothetical protein
MELIPRLLLPLIIEEEEGFRGAAAPEPERRPTPLIGVAPLGDKDAAPQDGSRFCATLPQGVGSPCSRCFGYHCCRRAGPPLGQGGGPPITDLGNGGRPLLVAETVEVGGDLEQRRLSHPDVRSDGWLHRRISDAPTGVDAGASNMSGGLGATTVLAVSSSMMAAPTEGSARGTCPMATRVAWAPRSRALCAEASQPAWCAAAPAAEASPVLRAFLGARPVKLYLRLLKEGEKTRSRHTEEKTKAEVSSDTYPLRTRANRACGEAPRASTLAGAAEGSLAADSGVASTSGARGAKGAARPGVVTMAGGPTSRAAGTSDCSWGTGGSA